MKHTHLIHIVKLNNNLVFNHTHTYLIHNRFVPRTLYRGRCYELYECTHALVHDSLEKQSRDC